MTPCYLPEFYNEGSMSFPLLKQRSISSPPQFSQVLPPLLERLLAQRGICSDAEIKHELSELADPFLMLGMEASVRRLILALRLQQRIVIVGDFDADGATSTALMMLVLEKFGFSHVSFMVPNRFEYGYGLSVAIVDELALQSPNLLLTVDNGISSVEGVARANQLGIDVIVTDHHLPGESLPAAFSIINPNQPGCSFPSKAMAGVGVAFHLLVALRKVLREEGWFTQQRGEEVNLAQYLDLVALGTVADVVPLDFYNRILVAQGVKRMRAGLMRPGLLQLMRVADKDYKQLTSIDLGFTLGPRLNAAGRLDDMTQGIILLLTDSDGVASELAQTLDSFNRERRLIEGQMQKEALLIVDSLTANLKELPRGFCLYHPDWHQGVVGLVASRLKEKFHRPVIAFAVADNGSSDYIEIKGSGRSIKGIHLRDVLAGIASKHPHMLSKFGGHAMAAGLSLQFADFEAFKQAYLDELEALPDQNVFDLVEETDGELQSRDFNLYTAQILRDAMPWGQSFPEPVFDGVFELKSCKVVGGSHLKCDLSLPLEGQSPLLTAIFFNADVDFWLSSAVTSGCQVRLVYRLSVNAFRGQQTLQLMIQYMALLR